ncbi:MAG: hypothetical protein ACI9MB_001381 [Verrucomicrobiales bacterium]
MVLATGAYCDYPDVVVADDVGEVVEELAEADAAVSEFSLAWLERVAEDCGVDLFSCG